MIEEDDFVDKISVDINDDLLENIVWKEDDSDDFVFIRKDSDNE